MRVPVRIVDLAFNRIGEVDLYSSLQITRSWHDIGTLQMRVNRYVKGADELRVGRIIFPTDRVDVAYVIRSREIVLDENGKSSENWDVTGIELKGILGQRITIPPPGRDQLALIGWTTEAAMKQIVYYTSIMPVDPGNKLANVTHAPTRYVGPEITWMTRYKNLAEELTEISIVTGLGWTMSLDINTKKFVFDALIGRNLTTGQNVLPPAIFSTEYGTIGSLSFSESLMNYRNYAIVAGQGEGAERRIVEVGTAKGTDRFTLFVDARDIAETEDVAGYDDPQPRPEADIIADLRARGEQKLAEYEQELYLEAEAIQTRSLQYRRDYDLGDIVTIKSDEWNLQRNARITEVKEIYEVDGTTYDLTFGYSRPTLGKVLRQKLDGIQPEITR